MQPSLRAVRALVVATLFVAALERGMRTEPFASAASRDLDVRCAARFACEAPSLLLAWVYPWKVALENTTREAVMQRDIDSMRGAAARKATEATRLRAGVVDRRAQASVMLQRANASRALIEQKKQAQSTLEIASIERKLAYVAQILVAGEGLSAEEAEATVVAHFKAHVASEAMQGVVNFEGTVEKTNRDVSLSSTSSASSQLGAWASFKAFFVNGGGKKGDGNGGGRDGDRDGDDGPTTTPTAVVLPRQNTSTSSSQQQPTSPTSTPPTSSPPLPSEMAAHELPSASSFVVPWAAARVLGVEIAALQEDVHAAEARALELRFGSAEGGVSAAEVGRSSETGEDAEVDEGTGTEALAERAERVGAEVTRLLADVSTRVDAMHAEIRRRIWSDAVSAGRACLLQRGLILSTSATSSDATAATAGGSPEDTAWWVVEVQLLVRSLQAAVVAVAVAVAVAAAFASSSPPTSTHTGSPSTKASDGGEAIVDKGDCDKEEEDVTGADGGSESPTWTVTGGAQSPVSGGLFLLHADSASPEQYTAYKEKVWFRSLQLDNDDAAATTLPRPQPGRKLTSTTIPGQSESDVATTSPSSLAANAPCSAVSPSSSSASISSSPLTMAKSLTEMEGNVGRLHVVIDKREATITQLRESMKEKNAQLAARDVEVAELRGAMISMTSTETNEARDWATSRERLADMKGTIANLEAELGSRNRDQDQSTTRIAELTQSVADIGNELAQRMVDISTAAAIIGRKDTVIAKMQSMLATYEEEKRAAWGGDNAESWSPTRRSEELSDGVDEGGGEGEGEGEGAGEAGRGGSEAAGGALDSKDDKHTRVWDAATRQRVAPPKEGRHFRNLLLERDDASTTFADASTNEPLQKKGGYHTPPANRAGGGRRIVVAPPMSAPPVRVPWRTETVQSRRLRTPPAPPPHDPFAFGRRVTMGERVHHHLSPDSSMGTHGGIDRGQIGRTLRASSIREAAAASSSRSGSGSPSKPSTSINASPIPSNSNNCGVGEAARRRQGEGSPHMRLEQLNNVLKARQEGKGGNVDASSGDSGEHENISRAQEARQLGLRYPVQRHTRGSFGYGRGFYWECCKYVRFSVARNMYTEKRFVHTET